MTANQKHSHQTVCHEAGAERVDDPVCGMSVAPLKAAGSYEYRGQRHFFCSLGCRDKFAAAPDRFLNPAPIAPVSIPRAQEIPADSYNHDHSRRRPSREYTCPMHPEIVRDGPGSCPICGMALEPRTVTLDEETNAELIDMTR